MGTKSIYPPTFCHVTSAWKKSSQHYLNRKITKKYQYKYLYGAKLEELKFIANELWNKASKDNLSFVEVLWQSRLALEKAEIILSKEHYDRLREIYFWCLKISILEKTANRAVVRKLI